MNLLLLGTGTSHGIPVIGCECPVCTSNDKRDRRYRCSAYITTNGGKNILIDIGPEFRLQAIENHIKKIDAVLLTHSHADHLHGIDDLRIFSCAMYKKPETTAALKKYNAPAIPIYTNKETLDDVASRFNYFFVPVKEGGGHAKVELIEAKNPFEFDDLKIIPVPMMHGHCKTVGWLFVEKDKNQNKKSIAYLTDCNFISDDSINLIKENCGTLEHLVIDGLRIDSHSTHFNILEAMGAAEKIGANNVWITHLTHNSSHVQYEQYIHEHLEDFPSLKNVFPAYDGLNVKLD